MKEIKWSEIKVSEGLPEDILTYETLAAAEWNKNRYFPDYNPDNKYVGKYEVEIKYEVVRIGGTWYGIMKNNETFVTKLDYDRAYINKMYQSYE